MEAFFVGWGGWRSSTRRSPTSTDAGRVGTVGAEVGTLVWGAEEQPGCKCDRGWTTFEPGSRNKAARRRSSAQFANQLPAPSRFLEARLKS